MVGLVPYKTPFMTEKALSGFGDHMKDIFSSATWVSRLVMSVNTAMNIR
jgi:hypothetical protein